MWECVCVSPLGAAAPAGSLALVCVFRDADKRRHKGVLSQPCQRVTPAVLALRVLGLSLCEILGRKNQWLCL